eukprot:8776720-Ditylum_brightwellii.AAC.2
MLEMLLAKNTTIYHAEVPTALIHQEQEKHTTELHPGNPQEGSNKKRKATGKVHPELKKKCADGLLKVAKGVSLSAICKFCNISVAMLCANKQCCVLLMVGMCKKAEYNQAHTITMAQEVAHILELLDKAIKPMRN